ncbi:MAG: hypothetical protein LUE88_01415 [Clostridiales bacterium]|nr:hypothetical protein [Clostridiales bacterium]
MERKIEAKVSAAVEPSISGALYGYIGRGVLSVKLNDDGEIVFVMSDGDEISIGAFPESIASQEILGLVKVGENLKIGTDGTLSVDTAQTVEEDNTKPVTSGVVYMEIGNIEILLENI